MPWHVLSAPSIALGTLQAVLHDAGIPCRTHSLYLAFIDFLAERFEGTPQWDSDCETLSARQT